MEGSVTGIDGDSMTWLGNLGDTQTDDYLKGSEGSSGALKEKVGEEVESFAAMSALRASSRYPSLNETMITNFW